jgi:hypothetical protein
LPDVPIAVTTYSTHPSGEAVRLLISAEIGAPDGAAPAEWGVAVNQNGKNVVTRRGRIPAGSARPWLFSTTVEVPPGDYRLRVAAADVEDRIGVLESAATAGFQTTASTVAGDLIVGVVTSGQLEPRRRIARSEEMIAVLDVLPGSGTILGGTLQLIPGGSARSVLSAPLTLQPAETAGQPAISRRPGGLPTKVPATTSDRSRGISTSRRPRCSSCTPATCRASRSAARAASGSRTSTPSRSISTKSGPRR